MRNLILIVAIAAGVVLAGVVGVQWGMRQAATNVSASSGKIDPGQSENWEVVRKWIETSGPANRSTLRMQVIRPGIILPPEAETYPPAPDDLSIVITREGNAPAQIEVRQGGQTWKVNENELDKLPPEIRLHVQRPLGWVLDGPAAGAALSGLLPQLPEASTDKNDDSIKRMEQRLDEMNARVEELLKSVQGMDRP